MTERAPDPSAAHKPTARKPASAKPAARRRRRTAAVPDEPTMPMWQRLLCAVAFAGGGGGFAAWGLHDMIAWVGALRHGATLVETESALLGLVPLGLSIAVIGPFFLVSAKRVAGWKRVVPAVQIAIFSMMVAGLVLATAGSLVLTGVMRGRGYRVCDVRHGTRMSFTTWALPSRPCPVQP